MPPTPVAGRISAMRLKFLLVTALAASFVTTGAASAAPTALENAHPCAGQPGFTCSTLKVPLDHTGRVPGTLDLQVATGDNTGAPKGVLLFLTGGPGQPGASAIKGITSRLPEVAKDYRFVMIDQRGTGEFGAIQCPGLQAQVGSSDIITATPEAVDECSGLLGKTAGLYNTDQNVADFDQLRQALGVEKMVVDGVSYGSFSAARYAVAHPEHVSKVVLDSVLPHHQSAEDTLYLKGLQAQARVLRDACTVAPACGFDPADDLAAVVRNSSTADGVRIFDMIVSYEFEDPTYRSAEAGDLIGSLHQARGGDRSKLDALLTGFKPGGDNVFRYSAGLHAATVCTDLRFPWGDAGSPSWLRQPSIGLTEHLLPARATWPYTAQVAVNQYFVQTCARWPSVRPASNPAAGLPNVPVLLLNGDRDLSTPLEWARQEAAAVPNGKLVVVKGASHSIQNRERGHAGRDALIDFLR